MTLRSHSKPVSGWKDVDCLGQWVIIDRSDDNLSLLSIGDHTFDETEVTSLRRTLNEKSRFLLLGPLREALESLKFTDSKVAHGGLIYQVTVRPIISPDKTIAVGAYGVFNEVATPLAPEPVIGTWQWRVSRIDGTNVGLDASQWDSVLLEDIYGITKEFLTSSRGPAGDWLNKLIAPKDRAAIKFMIDSGIDINNRKRHLLTYESVRGYGSSTPEPMQISNSARAYPDPDHPEAVMLRGFSRIVPFPTNLQLPGLSPVSEGEVLQSAFSLLSDRVFAELDMAQGITFVTSPSWAKFGLPPGFEMNITSLTHPDDIGPAEAYLEKTRASNVDNESLRVRLITVNDGYRQFRLTASPIDQANPARYILVQLIPAD
ncbi:hypothetical protein [Acaricomes phytoseiuli]|uniref:hypothetical protein n=1 Tax=Acaricomes phytoseiuli TaxID=291968 RepID=UPI00039FF72B|nr:hypothetical protein [Acaricomes phytoseiuli]